MKSVLLIQYSQSGQLSDVAAHIIAPLVEAPDIEVTVETLMPVSPYPFPWPVLRFFDTFPEAVYLDAPPMQPQLNAAWTLTAGKSVASRTARTMPRWFQPCVST